MIDRRTLREQVLDALHQRIAEGSLPAGARLTEVALSEDFSVSRGTVREALRHLQEEGLAVQHSRGSVYVRRLAAQEVSELYEIRSALEGLAMSRILTSADREATAALLQQKLDELGEQSLTFFERIEADLAFHQCLCQLAGNLMLLRTWEQLSHLIRGMLASMGEPIIGPLMVMADHQLIVDAIKTPSANSHLVLPRLLKHSAEQLSAAIDTHAQTHSYLKDTFQS